MASTFRDAMKAEKRDPTANARASHKRVIISAPLEKGTRPTDVYKIDPNNNRAKWKVMF